MSILSQIACRVEEGQLFPVMPRTRSQPIRRRIFLVESLNSAIESPLPGEVKRYDELHADLVSFVVQADITPEFLWLLKPKTRGVWEIRSHRVDPQIRVFGHFAQKDVFIAMSYEYRSDLGGIDDSMWMYQIRIVENCWQELFPAYTAMKSSDQNKLFTGAIDEKYFKDE